MTFEYLKCEKQSQDSIYVPLVYSVTAQSNQYVVVASGNQFQNYSQIPALVCMYPYNNIYTTLSSYCGVL